MPAKSSRATAGRYRGRRRAGTEPRTGSDVDAALGEPVLGVGRAAVHAATVDLVVQVRPGREALVADLRDLVAGVHDLPGLDAVVAHVPVDVHVAVGVLDVDGVAEAGHATG